MPRLMDYSKYNDPNWFNYEDPNQLGLLLGQGRAAGFRAAQNRLGDKWSWMNEMRGVPFVQGGRQGGVGLQGPLLRPGITQSTIGGLGPTSGANLRARMMAEAAIPKWGLGVNSARPAGKEAPSLTQGQGPAAQMGGIAEAAGGTPGQGLGAWLSNVARAAGIGNAPRGTTYVQSPQTQGTTPTFGIGETPQAQMMRQELGIVPFELGEQYRNVADQGAYGIQGMQNVLGPVERAEDIVLQGLGDYVDKAGQMFSGLTQESLAQARSEGARARRRTLQGMGGVGATRPGVAGRMYAEAAAPIRAEQARQEGEARKQETSYKMALEESAKALADQITMQRGERRSGLIDQNIQSKYQGLHGMQAVNAYMADLLNGRFWDPTNPMESQYNYQTGIMGQQQAYDLARLNLQQYFNVYRDKLNHQQQMELAQLQAKLNEPGAWDRFMGFLGVGASFVPGIGQALGWGLRGLGALGGGSSGGGTAGGYVNPWGYNFGGGFY